VDAYGLTAAQRRRFVDQMIQFAICDTAWEADDAAITPETMRAARRHDLRPRGSGRRSMLTDGLTVS
jgi:hypothetical protein